MAINEAYLRWLKAVENGKKGGRPKIELSAEEVMAKYQELGKWSLVAEALGVSEDTLRRFRETAKGVYYEKYDF